MLTIYRGKLRLLAMTGAALSLTATLTGLAGLAGALTGASTASAAPLPNGTAYSWGANFDGQFGDGTTTNRTSPVPVHLPAGATVKAIAANGYDSIALISDGRVLGWGNNFQGQLGNGTTTSSTTPVRALLPAGTFAAAVSAGDAQGLAIANP